MFHTIRYYVEKRAKHLRNCRALGSSSKVRYPSKVFIIHDDLMDCKNVKHMKNIKGKLAQFPLYPVVSSRHKNVRCN